MLDAAKKLIFLIGSVCFVCYLQHADTTPKKTASCHQALLRRYFANLFCHEGFGYTLLGARAAAFDLINSPTPFSSAQSRRQKIIFNSDKYLFKESKTESHLRFITFVHKKKFLEVFDENKDIFHKALGKETTGESLLQKLACSENHLIDVLDWNEVLLGILLGFGRENSLLFARWGKVASEAHCEQLPTHFSQCGPCWYKPRGFTPEKIEPAQGFRTIQEEQAWFTTHFNGNSYKREEILPFILISPLFFRVKKSSETAALIQKYRKCKEVLNNLFYDRDPVEVVFEQLTAENPDPEHKIPLC